MRQGRYGGKEARRRNQGARTNGADAQAFGLQTQAAKRGQNHLTHCRGGLLTPETGRRLIMYPDFWELFMRAPIVPFMTLLWICIGVVAASFVAAHLLRNS